MPNHENQNAEARSNESLRTKLRNATNAFEDTVKAGPLRRAKYILRLYVTGSSARSLKAVHNLKKICDEHLAGEYEIEIIDLLERPQLASGDQILAIPTLVRKLPEPIRKIIGDLSNTERVLVGLDLRQAK